MDRRNSLRKGSCNGSSKPSSPASPAAGSRVGGHAKEEADGERKSLLPQLPPRGGAVRKSRSRSKRRVQWNDSHGKKLVEVLEFEPSDSSDSEDEFLDTCICTVM